MRVINKNIARAWMSLITATWAKQPNKAETVTKAPIFVFDFILKVQFAKLVYTIHK